MFRPTAQPLALKNLLMVLTVGVIVLLGGLGDCRVTVHAAQPVLLDTDLGNDIDDVFAIAILHALESRGECDIAAITLCNNHPLAVPFCDWLNRYYGREDLPIGALKTGSPNGDGPYLKKVFDQPDMAKQLASHTFRQPADVPTAVEQMRRTLVAVEDHALLIIAIGVSTNLAALLDSPADAISPLDGRELVQLKVQRLVMMAGDFSRGKAEFNVFIDAGSAGNVFANWPTEIVLCPYEIGEAVHLGEYTLDHDYAYDASHPLMLADEATFGKRNGFMAWDLAAVLYAVRPNRDYFTVSQPGTVVLDKDHVTRLENTSSNLHRYLTISADRIPRAREVISALASQPPAGRTASQ